MAGIKGAGRPTDIENPVENIANAVTPQIAPMDIPAPTSEAPMAGVPSSSLPAEPEINPFEVEMSAEVNPFEDDAPTPVESDPMDDRVRSILGMQSSAEEKAFNDANEVPSLSTRFKRGFAGDNEDFNAQALEQQYGKDSVRKEGENFQVKVDGKWKNVAQDDSFLGMVADNAKMYTDTALTMAGGAAVAVPGSILPGAGTIGGAMLGAGAGRAAATGIDKAAEAAFFENREGKSTERLMTDAGLELLGNVGESALLEGAGGVAAKGLAKGLQMSASGVKRAGEWAAKHEASQALGAKLQSGLETLKGSVSQILGMQDELKVAGYIEDLKGTDTFVTAGQTTEIGGKLAANLPEAVRESVNVAQENILMTGVKKFFSEIGNFGKAASNVGERFAGKINEWRKVEGAFIGNFEKQMIEAAGDGSLKLNTTVSAVDELASKLGIVKGADGKLTGMSADVARDVDEVASSFTGNSEQARDMLRRTRELVIDLFNNEGRMSMAEIHKQYKKLSLMTNGFTDEVASSGYGREMIKLKNAVRDDMLRLGDAIMDGSAQYRKSRASYSQIKDGVDVFDNILKTDGVTSKVMARAIFNGGKDGLTNLRTMKNLLMSRDPNLWKDMVGQFTNDVMEQSTVAGKTNFGAVKKKFDALGTETLDELFGKQKGDLFKKFLGLAELTQKRALKGATEPVQRGLIKNAIQFGDTGAEIVAMVNNGAIAEQITKEGIENYAKSLGSSQPIGVVKKALERIVDTARKGAGLAAQYQDELVTAGKSVESGVGRAAIKTGAAALSSDE